MSKRKNTLLICSALTFGALLLPLVSCGDENVEKACEVIFQTSGSAKDKVKISYDKETFEPGDELTFTLKLENEVEINKIIFNDSEIKKKDTNVYTVVLKKGPNYLTVDATFTGTIKPTIDAPAVLLFEDGKELKMEKKGNVFESPELEVPKKTRFGVFIKNGTKFDEYSSISVLNVEKTFAGITNSPVNHGPYRNVNLLIEGGAKYKFYYDETLDYPLYVVRSTITKLPSEVSHLKSLLDNGLLKGETYNTRTDLKSSTLDVKTTLYDGLPYTENSSFNHYANDISISSFETSRGEGKTKSFVYNQIKDGILYTVDTLSDKVASTPDENPKSYKYKITDNKSGYSAYLKTNSEAKFDVSQAIRHQGHIGSLFSQALYELGGTDDGIEIKSTKQNDKFVTNFKSRKITTTGGTGSSNICLMSDGSLTFRNDGALLDAKLITKLYDSSSYNFDSLEFIPGKENAGVEITNIKASYTYGLKDLKTSPQNYEDVKKYFVQSIDSVVLKEAGIPDEGNNLYPGTLIDFGSSTSGRTMKMTFSPETALDTEQYGIISSSNTGVIDKAPGQSTRYETRKKDGSSTLTIGNYADNTVKATTTVKVHNVIPLKYMYIHDPYSPLNYNYFDKRLETTTNKAVLMAETKTRIRLASAPDNANIANLFIKPVGGTLIENNPKLSNIVSLDKTDDYVDLIVDLSAYRPKPSNFGETLVVPFAGPNFDTGYDEHSSILTFTILPSVDKEDILGTWVSYVLDKGKETTSIKTKMIVAADSITIEENSRFKELEIIDPAYFTKGKIYDTPEAKVWDFYPGYYGLNVAGLQYFPEDRKEATGFDFVTIYYNPYTKCIDAGMTFTRWAGLEAETFTVVGDYSSEHDSIVPEQFHKIA